MPIEGTYELNSLPRSGVLCFHASPTITDTRRRAKPPSLVYQRSLPRPSRLRVWSTPAYGTRGKHEVRVPSRCGGGDRDYDDRRRSDSRPRLWPRPKPIPTPSPKPCSSGPMALPGRSGTDDVGPADPDHLPRAAAFGRVGHRRTRRRVQSARLESRGTPGREPAERRRSHGVRPQVPARAAVSPSDRAWRRAARDSSRPRPGRGVWSCRRSHRHDGFLGGRTPDGDRRDPFRRRERPTPPTRSSAPAAARTS